MTDSFGVMLHRYRGLIYSLCRRYSRRGASVDDLIQDATIALWKAYPKIEPLPAIQQAALIWRIAHNAIVDVLRREHEQESLPDTYEQPNEDNSLIHDLYEQIGMLDEPDRTIIRMQLEGYSYEEIGNALNMSEKNVSVRLVRTKDKLRKNMHI